MADIANLVEGDEGTRTWVFKNKAGTAIDFSGSTCVFRMDTEPYSATPGAQGGNVIPDLGGTVEATQGELSYTFTKTDTATAGDFRARFKVTFPDGHEEWVPRPGFIPVHIAGELTPP